MAIWKGINPILRGQQLTMVINHLLTGMILQVARTRTSADPSSERNVLDGILIETTGLADPGDDLGGRKGCIAPGGRCRDDGFLRSYT